jgi:hypothetical protein
MRRAPAAAAAAAAAALLLLSLAAPAAAKPSEFTPSVVMTNFGEMGAPCFQMVDNAARLNANSIKFVPTVHYWGNAEHIGRFCYRWVCGMEAGAPPGRRAQQRRSRGNGCHVCADSALLGQRRAHRPRLLPVRGAGRGSWRQAGKRGRGSAPPGRRQRQRRRSGGRGGRPRSMLCAL